MKLSVFFIDPDGMSPLPVAVTSNGMGVDGVKDIGAGGSGGFDVRTYDRDGNTLDSVTVNSNQGVAINADGDITKNDLQTPGDSGGADVSLGGGGCPPGVVCEGMQRGNTPIPIGDSSNSSGSNIVNKSSNDGWQMGPIGVGIAADIAWPHALNVDKNAPSGYGISMGVVADAKNNLDFYFTFKTTKSQGISMSLTPEASYTHGTIGNVYNSTLQGNATSMSAGLGGIGGEISTNAQRWLFRRDRATLFGQMVPL